MFRVREADLGIDEPRVALAVLERAGALELFPAPAGSAAGRIADARLSKRHLAAAVVAGRRVERRRWDRLAAIDGYATEGGCRRAALLRYFSDEPSSVPPDRCCDVCGAAVVRLPEAATPRPLPAADVDAPALVLRAVDETGGRVGRTRIVQILRGSQGRALVAAGHDRLDTYGTLAALSADDVLREVDSLIGSGALELTGGPYPLVRRPAGAQAATARDAELRAQVARARERPAPRRGFRSWPASWPPPRIRSCARLLPGRSASSAASGPRRRSGRPRPTTTPTLPRPSGPRWPDPKVSSRPCRYCGQGACAGSRRLRSSPRS